MAGGLNKILYVEDDPTIAELAQMVLTAFGGFDVRHCASGAEAIAAFSGFAPQMLLLDVMMPEMDGPQTLQNIRSMPGGDDVPAVFMTARVQVHERESYMQLGAVGVIPKPFDPVTLSDQIAEMWRLSSAEAFQDS